MNKFRSHNCGELSLKNNGEVVHIAGWINKKRDHGGLLFIDLRDHYGLTQCVFDSNIKNFEKILYYIFSKVKMTKASHEGNLDNLNYSDT